MVCMVVNPHEKTKIISIAFPQLVLRVAGQKLQFVNEFRYLGHILCSSVKDDTDIEREIKKICIVELIILPESYLSVHVW